MCATDGVVTGIGTVVAESVRVCGREFSGADIERVRKEIGEASPALRAEIARRVCEALDWTDALGRAKLMSARVALLRLHRAGWIELPPPRNGNGNGKGLSERGSRWPEEGRSLAGSVRDLPGLAVEPVAGRDDSARWNVLIERYHYLGYTPLPGAQLRYLIRWQGGVLGALGFGAAAWNVAVRDRWIGWGREAREQHLARVLNNARFLLLPWVQVQNLASKVLALASRRIGADFEARYGIRPVLLETFVETGRFRGTCYRAANWLSLGETRGRGKCDRTHRARLPVKAVYVYPLERAFRPLLGVQA
jgi:hypothetical protein